jgi:PAS domain S-box-containing protein/diguanylate cyclase (GGDEF)-like protein
MSVVSRPLVDDAGTLIGSVVGLHEIDEQVRERERLQATLDSLLDPHVMLQALRDPSGRIVDFVFTDANEAACLYNAKSKAELLGMRMLELLPGHAGTGLLAMYAAVVETGEPLALDDFTYAHEAQHGELRYYDVRAVRQGDALSYTWRDVTDRHASAEAIRESEERYRLLAENAMDLVISLDMKAKVQWVSPSVSTMLGYEPRELLGRFSAVLFRADDLPLMLDTAARAREGEPVACRLRMVTKGGDERWVEVTPRTLHDATGTLVGGVIGVRDVHEEVTARAALEHEVEFDALTGLARRPAALAWIREILGARHDSPWALLCVGINGMTSINQAYTYAAGDAVLRAAADRLVAAAAAHDHVARIAGDEFAVLLRADVSESDAANEAERLLTAVRGVVAVGAQQVEVTACVGIAMFTGQDAEDLLRDATAAMRQAAAVGRDRWEFLGGNVGEQTRQALEVQSQLRGALREGRIRPWLMPIVSMATGDVVGYEALARWMLADGTVKAPDEFLGVAERTGLVREIDRVILSESLDALTTMAQQISLGVNVSGVTLASPDFADSVRRELERTGIDPSRLSLEVTETALFRITDSVRSSMESLAELGASWWVDDFGTGFSSISHLRDLPIAGLKLDRSFTSGVTFGSSRATRLSRGLAGLAHGLGLATVAEGVETAEQAEVLAGQGWQMGQGWLYGKPVPLPVAAGVAPTMS